ncbi:hypothetical protein BGW42_001582 [Actinomortierella wolfii]|nr:hypothetical protein BGW42_001582 [Actinomortierella wolfii]
MASSSPTSSTTSRSGKMAGSRPEIVTTEGGGALMLAHSSTHALSEGDPFPTSTSTTAVRAATTSEPIVTSTSSSSHTSTTITTTPEQGTTSTSSSSSTHPQSPQATSNTRQETQESRQERLVRPWYRPPPRGYRAPTRHTISIITTANILASGYSTTQLSELIGVSGLPPLSHHSLAAFGNPYANQAHTNSNNNTFTTSPQPGAPSASLETSTIDPWTHETLLAYLYRSTTYIIRIPFREMIGGGDRPYDPTAEAVYPDIPLNAFRHTPSATTLPDPPAGYGWLKRCWWYVQQYLRQLRRGTRGKSRSVMMAIKFSWLLTILYTLAMIVAFVLDQEENCIILKVFLGVFVVHKFIVTAYTMDRALYRLPLDLVEHDPDIDDEQANGLAKYGLIRRRIISRRNGGYQSNGIVNTVDLNELDRAIENTTGAGFDDGKQITITAAIAAIPEVIYRKPNARAGAGAAVAATTTVTEAGGGDGDRDGDRMATHNTSIAKRKSLSATVLPSWEPYLKASQNHTPAAPSSGNETSDLNSSIESAKKTHRKLSSIEKRDQVIVQIEIDEQALNIPDSGTRTNSRNSISMEQSPQQQNSHNRSTSQASIPSSVSIPPPPTVLAEDDLQSNSSSTPCAPLFSAPIVISPLSSSSSPSSLSNVSVDAESPKNTALPSPLPRTNIGGGITITTDIVTASTMAAHSPTSEMPRDCSRRSLSYHSSRLSIAGSGVLAQLVSAEEIAAATETEQGQAQEQKLQDNLQHNQQVIEEGCTSVPMDCAVCLYDFEDGETLRHLRCDHYFHRDCVDRWLVKHPFCPTCRTPI